MNQKVEPCPTTLSTPIRPPIKAAKRLQIVRPQPGAAIAARGGTVSLGERLEDVFLLVGRYADTAVGHQKTERNGALIFMVFADLQRYAALGGEFDGVVDQVDDDLAQSAGVTVQ